jgi:hypothetical protein
MKFCFVESNIPLLTHVTRGSDVAHGKEVFAGPAVPSALCQVFPLGTGCAERNWACAESIALSAKPYNSIVICSCVDFTFVPGGEEKAPTRPREGTFVPGGGSDRYKWADLTFISREATTWYKCGCIFTSGRGTPVQM